MYCYNLQCLRQVESYKCTLKQREVKKECKTLFVYTQNKTPIFVKKKYLNTYDYGHFGSLITFMQIAAYDTFQAQDFQFYFRYRLVPNLNVKAGNPDYLQNRQSKLSFFGGLT